MDVVTIQTTLQHFLWSGAAPTRGFVRVYDRMNVKKNLGLGKVGG